MGQPPAAGFPPEFDLGGGALLRWAVPDDAIALYEAVCANREHLRAWLPWVDATLEARDTRAFLEQDLEQRERGLSATYLLLLDGAIAGSVGLHQIDPLNRAFFIGYWIARACEGRGLVTRACDALLRVAFGPADFERAVIRCAVSNGRSAAIPRRLGFRFEGVERHAQRLRGGFVDLEIYSRLRGD